MKDKKQCKHCHNDIENEPFCSFCGRPRQEDMKIDTEQQVDIRDVGDTGHPEEW